MKKGNGGLQGKICFRISAFSSKNEKLRNFYHLTMIEKSKWKSSQPIIECKLSERHFCTWRHSDRCDFSRIISRRSINWVRPRVYRTHILIKFHGFMSWRSAINICASSIKICGAWVIVNRISVSIADILDCWSPAISNSYTEI